MIDPAVNIKRLRREWVVALTLAIVGGLSLIAVVVFSIMSGPNQVTPAQNSNATAARQVAHALCTAGLSSAQGFAIVPAYTSLANDLVKVGAVSGRYTCFAQTDAAKYQITFDLMCKDLNNPKCVNLFSVMQDGTGAIYQRQ